MSSKMRNPLLLRMLATHADDVASSVSRDRLPILLRRLAERRRVTSVEFRPLLVDAVLTTHAHGFRILFNSDQRDPDELETRYYGESAEQLADTRIRFSLAHELAHTLFYDLSSSPPTIAKAFRAGGGKTALENLERNCDKLAGHLLLPGALFEPAIVNMKTIMPESLRELAKNAGVSLEALIRRLGTRSNLLKQRYFRGCIAIVLAGSNGVHVRAVSIPQHLNVARDLQLIRPGEKWQVTTSNGIEINLAALPNVSEVSLVTSGGDRGTAKGYRMHLDVVSRFQSEVSYLVILEELNTE
jgi:uncharacterized protein DUF955